MDSIPADVRSERILGFSLSSYKNRAAISVGDLCTNARRHSGYWNVGWSTLSE